MYSIQMLRPDANPLFQYFIPKKLTFRITGKMPVPQENSIVLKFSDRMLVKYQFIAIAFIFCYYKLIVEKLCAYK